MRTFKSLIMAALAVLTVSSCSEKEEGPQKPVDHVKINPTIMGLTRATDTAWEANDAIGIFMKKAGQALDATNTLASNQHYTITDPDGPFGPATWGDALFFPEDNSKVDLVAYYPYEAALSGYNYAVDITNQAQPAKIDLLYSNDATNLGKGEEDVDMTFKHMLSKLILNVVDESGESLTGMTVVASGMKTKATFNLATASLTDDAGSVANISAVVKANGATAVAEAIILPNAGEAGREIVFTIAATNKSFKWEIDASKEFLASHKYTFDVNLKTDGSVAISPSSTITDWTDVPSETIDLDKDGSGVTPPGPGTVEEFFLETFGNGDYSSSSARKKINDFTDGDMQPAYTYKDSYENADIRSTATINPAIWFPGNKDSELEISGIAAGYTSMKLTFDIMAQTNGTNANAIEVQANGTATTEQPEHQFTSTNSYQTVSVALPDNTTVVTLFSSSAKNANGFRVDNIRIEGAE